MTDLGTKLTARDMEPGTGVSRGSLTARMRLNGRPMGLFSIYTTGELSINVGWNARLAELGDDLSERYRAEAEQHGFPVDLVSWTRGWNMTPLVTIEQRFDAFEGFMTSVANELHELAAKRAAPES